jgi:hypothetical protein
MTQSTISSTQSSDVDQDARPSDPSESVTMESARELCERISKDISWPDAEDLGIDEEENVLAIASIVDIFADAIERRDALHLSEKDGLRGRLERSQADADELSVRLAQVSSEQDRLREQLVLIGEVVHRTQITSLLAALEEDLSRHGTVGRFGDCWLCQANSFLVSRMSATSRPPVPGSGQRWRYQFKEERPWEATLGDRLPTDDGWSLVGMKIVSLRDNAWSNPDITMTYLGLSEVDGVHGK